MCIQSEQRNRDALKLSGYGSVCGLSAGWWKDACEKVSSADVSLNEKSRLLHPLDNASIGPKLTRNNIISVMYVWMVSGFILIFCIGPYDY